MRGRFRRRGFRRGGIRRRRFDWIRGGDFQSDVTGQQQILSVPGSGGLMVGGTGVELITQASLAMHEDSVTCLRIRGNIHWLFNWAQVNNFLINNGADVTNVQDVVVSMREAISIVTLDDQFNPPANYGTGLVNVGTVGPLLGAGTNTTQMETWWHSSRDIMWQRESHWHPAFLHGKNAAGTGPYDAPYNQQQFALNTPSFPNPVRYPHRWSAEDEIDVVTKRRVGSHETLVYNVFIGFGQIDDAMAFGAIPFPGENTVIALGLGYLKLLLKHN